MAGFNLPGSDIYISDKGPAISTRDNGMGSANYLINPLGQGIADGMNMAGIGGQPGGGPGGDPYAGMPKIPGYQSKKQGQAYDFLKGQATNTAMNPWALMALKKSKLDMLDQIEKSKMEAGSATALAEDNIAARGGLSSGARERAQTEGVKNLLSMTQDARRTGAKNELQIGMEDAGQKAKMLTQLGAIEQDDVTGQNSYNMNKYGTEMNTWAAGKQAEATAAAGSGGGGIGSWICTEVHKHDKWTLGEMRALKKVFNFAKNNDPKGSAPYFEKYEGIIKLLNEKKANWIEIKKTIQDILTLPTIESQYAAYKFFSYELADMVGVK